jgi:hypothetical protein
MLWDYVGEVLVLWFCKREYTQYWEFWREIWVSRLELLWEIFWWYVWISISTFIHLPKPQFVWAMLHLTSLWTNSWDICVLLECDWFFSVIQPPKVALYMGMLLWSDFLGPTSGELWANFVTIDIVTIMTSGLI